MSLRQIIKKTLNEHKSKRTVYIYTQPEVKTLNRILNSVLKKKYDWFIGINIIFLEKNDFGIQRPKLAGVLKVDEDWFGEQWRKFYYSTPVPNPNQEDVSIGDIVGGSQALDLSETIKTVLSIAFGEIIDGFQWIDLYIRTEDIEKGEVSEGEIKTVKKILSEEVEDLGERTKLEKSVMRFINVFLKGKELPENFYGVVVDVYNTKYGQGCNISFLMKKPFKLEDSDELYNLGFKVKDLIKNFFSDEFKYGINISNSTVGNYKELKKRIQDMKNDEVSVGEITEKCWPGYTQKGMKTMFGKRYPNCVKKTKK